MHLCVYVYCFIKHYLFRTLLTGNNLTTKTSHISQASKKRARGERWRESEGGKGREGERWRKSEGGKGREGEGEGEGVRVIWQSCVYIAYSPILHYIIQ